MVNSIKCQFSCVAVEMRKNKTITIPLTSSMFEGVKRVRCGAQKTANDILIRLFKHIKMRDDRIRYAVIYSEQDRLEIFKLYA